MKIASWNVNGIRAAEKKGLFDWMETCGADIVCLQETKAQPDQLTESFSPPGWHVGWASAERKGYSGTAIYSRTAPSESTVLGAADFDGEGRVLINVYDGFTLINCYFPNSQSEGKRLDYKLAFNRALHSEAARRVEAGENVIITGDFNVAHKPIDLARPKSNEKNPGYLPQERDWMTEFTEAGFVDTFRLFHPEPDQYTWWSYRMNAREKNIGWRLDYFCVNEAFKERVADSTILAEVSGSDHCPVMLELK